MTATEKLCMMLKERGVGTYKHEVPEAVCLAYFDGARWHDCWESTGGEVNVTFSMTPEQAVAATLGAGTCRDANVGGSFVCSECGANVRDATRWYSISNEHSLRFCPNCGRRVVDA